MLTVLQRMALCRGRPSHIVDNDWATEILPDESISDSEDEGDGNKNIEGSTEAVAGGTAFKWLISLTRIVSEMLQKF